MNKRKACFVGLAAAASLLAGCVSMYRNPSACEDEMQSRLAEVSPGNKLSIAHSAVSYRGQRVVVEGALARPPVTASAAAAASSASAAVEASAAEAASGAMAVSTASATAAASAALDASSASFGSGALALAPQGASAPVAASGAAVAAAASAASATKATQAEPKPATPVAALAQKLGIKKPTFTQTAAECMFNESGLVSFRWLAPPAFAKTTPDPNASDDE
ncbi:hypothetical protein [Paraburkholderia sp. J12]|uniref:hypothetical protein n=1 Tax=Paraburkholderia sp. J12 TaxID=2805432 RepID=UPI002ABDD28C|nr:hypothetical protein [Paraburkholderia sp. J12]